MTIASLSRRQLNALVAAADDAANDELRDLGLIDDAGRLTIAGRALMPPLLPYAVMRDQTARELIAEVEADDRRA